MFWIILICQSSVYRPPHHYSGIIEELPVVRVFSFSYNGGRSKNYGVNGKKLFMIFSSTAAPTLHDDVLNTSRLSSFELCNTGNNILVRCVR